MPAGLAKGSACSADRQGDTMDVGRTPSSSPRNLELIVWLALTAALAPPTAFEAVAATISIAALLAILLFWARWLS
jgi:hypothetical protein